MDNYNDYYKTVSSKYNEIRLDPLPDFNNTISIIRQNLTPGGAILDIGCGTGKYSEALGNLGYIVEGIDKSESQVKEAQKVIKAQVGDSGHLPFEDCFFDGCIMIMMIQQLSIDERKKSFIEAYRVLKKNGTLIIKTASEKDLQHRISSMYFPSALKEDYTRYPSLERLKVELSIFKTLKIIPTCIDVTYLKNHLAESLLSRRTSNLRKLTDEELKEGVNKLLLDYNDNELICKKTYNTFIVAIK